MNPPAVCIFVGHQAALQEKNLPPADEPRLAPRFLRRACEAANAGFPARQLLRRLLAAGERRPSIDQ